VAGFLRNIRLHPGIALTLRHVFAAHLEHTDLVAAFPPTGAPVADFPGVRSVLHTPIRIYYRVNDKRDSVEIIHFEVVNGRSKPQRGDSQAKVIAE
jgi:hypothetical protein